MKKNYLVALTLFFMFSMLISPVVISAAELFRNKQTSYTIVVSPTASVSEKNAAKELSEMLFRVSGATFPIAYDLNHNSGNHIFVGYNERVAPYVGGIKPSDSDESFVYLTVGNDIIIYGGRDRGTQYGVFSFLEQQIGVSWYAHDYTHIPTLKTLTLGKLNHKESPAFECRELYYYAFRVNPDFAAHNLINCSESFLKDKNYGTGAQYWGNHTMGKFITSKEWFGSHPEYFALRSGKRVDNGQLCLSNKNVLRLLTEAMLNKINQSPGYWCYDLSQNDNRLFCECKQCQQIEKRYGGHSGLIIWAVNQVADAVKKVYPQKYIGTFAYSYSQQPPKGIRPADNVIIRLSNVRCCFTHPLATDANNKDFMNDLQQWSQLAKNLYIWDYLVGFQNYLAPFPNFNVLAGNLQTFRNHHVIGLFEEGQYQSYYSEFSELRQWVVAKLMWNPYQDVNALVARFIKDYYGAAAQEIQQYFDLTQQLVTPDLHIGIHFKVSSDIYSSDYIGKSRRLLDRALKKVASDSVLSARVDRVRNQILFVQYRLQRAKVVSDGSLNDMFRVLSRDKTHVHEKQTYQQFIDAQSHI